MTAVGRYPKLTFLVGALAISSLSGWVVASPRFSVHPGLLSYAVLADLVVTMPVFYYYVVLRGRSVSLVTVFPIVVLGLIRARMLIPAKQLHQLPGVELFVGLAEVVALAWLGSRALQLRRMYRHVGLRESTFADTFAEAVRESFGKSPFTSFVISEVSILYYGLFSWRAEVEIPDGAVATTSHRRSGWSGRHWNDRGRRVHCYPFSGCPLEREAGLGAERSQRLRAVVAARGLPRDVTSAHIPDVEHAATSHWDEMASRRPAP